MKECKITKAVVVVSLLLTVSLSSCYYDNYEDLAAGGNACDTVSMTYSADIAPLLLNHCTGCHGGQAPAGNISLETYDQVKVQALKGSLLGTIEHAQGWSPMPKNEAKLDPCTISKVKAWINRGMKY